ncbi:hypothetical protein [Microvirga sp. M2]|uniref:hypothetical protein n=1 Tax=Microvirga sp. M2 TaxID=3073270 RepID=UPI0039C1F8C0
MAWKAISLETAIRRAQESAALDLTYEDNTLEILERGRYLQATDTKRMTEIKLRRAHEPVEFYAPSERDIVEQPMPGRRSVPAP